MRYYRYAKERNTDVHTVTPFGIKKGGHMFGSLCLLKQLGLLAVALVAGAALFMALLGSTAMNAEDDSGSAFVGLGGVLFLLAAFVAYLILRS